MSMIDEGLAMMAVEAAAYLEQPITYTSGAFSVSIGAIVLPSKALDASILGLVQDQMTALQLNPENQDRDFSILASVLKLNGVLVLPLSADRITWLGRLYDVSTQLSGPYPWEWTDNEQRLRVHTKFLRVAP